MLSSGNHVHSLCLSALVCWTSLLYLVTCTAVFSISEFAQKNVLVALVLSTSPCVCHGWVVVES